MKPAEHKDLVKNFYLMQVVLHSVTKQRLSFVEMQALCFALTSRCPVIPNRPGICSDLSPRGKGVKLCLFEEEKFICWHAEGTSMVSSAVSQIGRAHV